jgi:acetyl-CoA acyltransferase
MSESGRNTVIIDGCRIPFQRSGTGYRALSSYDLGRLAIKAVLRKTEIDPLKIDSVIMGTVAAKLDTSNVAREAALAAGVPAGATAYTVSAACISANRAITCGADAIGAGQADFILAGGTESLTDIPIIYKKSLRIRLMRMARAKGVSDYLKLLRGLGLSDLLPEVPKIAEFSTGRSMGEDCDRLAARIGVSRQEQDFFAMRSHQLAAKAAAEGLLAQEMEPVRVPPDFTPIVQDNGFRADTSLEQLAQLKPAFQRPYGTVTAGNSSFLTDGAAAVLLASEEAALAEGYRPKAIIRGYAYSGQDPLEELLLGPAYAVSRLLEKSGLELGDIDVIESHEAFAGQVLANIKSLASDWFAREKLGRARKVGEVRLEKLNTLGGSLSLGHPFGATGARLVTTAVNRLIRENGRFAIVTGCAAGGLGNAILLERYG